MFEVLDSKFHIDNVCIFLIYENYMDRMLCKEENVTCGSIQLSTYIFIFVNVWK